MNIRMLRVAAVLAAGCGSAFAQADTITARYNGLYAQDTDVTQLSVFSGSVQTVTFEWTRQDAPGAGIDSTLPGVFRGYCVELSQNVAPNTDYTFDVVTATQHGFTSLQEMLLGRLWASYQPSVNDGATSAAFQMAVWELAFDTGADLAVGQFTGNSPPAVVVLSQSWLNAITSASYSGGQAPIAVLESEGVQDQLVPTPGSLALLASGSLLITRRRR